MFTQTAEQHSRKQRKCEETAKDRQQGKLAKNNTTAGQPVASKMMNRPKPAKNVNKAKKSAEGQLTRRRPIVIKPPKPVECRGAPPRKPLCLQMKTNRLI